MFLRILVAILAAGTTLAAQGGGLYSGMRGAGDTPAAAAAIGAPKTLFEQFTDQLKLDAKTQLPAVQEIIINASKEATPVARDMLQTRQALANAELGNKPDEVKTALAAYTTAATKMAALEAQAFASVYALLKPNQQSKAPEAFATMAGIFVPPAPTAPRPGQRGGGGRGGR